MPGGELRIRTVLHPNPLGRWISFPVVVADRHELLMVLDPGSPISAISPETRDNLTERDLLRSASHSRYEHRLTSLVVDRQQLPDVDVRVLPRLSRLRIDGLIGLDFLSQFDAIHYYVRARELVLEYPERLIGP